MKHFWRSIFKLYCFKLLWIMIGISVQKKTKQKKKKQNGQQCRFWLDDSFWTISSGSTVSAKVSFFVCTRTDRAWIFRHYNNLLFDNQKSMAEWKRVWTLIRLHCSLDKMFFRSKNIDIFLISPRKHMLWVLIRSASVRCFKWVPTTYVFVEK